MIQNGNFKIIPFNVAHDSAEPFGYFINHPDMGNLVFITDTYYIPNRFDKLNNLLVEANYDKAILKENVDSGRLHPKVRNRVIKSHMEIETTIEFLKANNLTQVNNIVLIHLSNNNSNATDFKRKVEAATGKNVHIAGKGLNINFSINIF